MEQIVQVETSDHFEIASQLLREYEQSLGLNLCFQGFETELATLPGKYAPPRGSLLLAFVGNTPAGIIAMRPIEHRICEMKRLYVRPSARGRNLGRKLIRRIMSDARDAGYVKMRLDTLTGKMDHAIALYREFGFYEIPAYFGSPLEHELFLQADLV